MVNIIHEFTDEHGKSPYAEWLSSLRDMRARARVIVFTTEKRIIIFIYCSVAAIKPHSPEISNGRKHIGAITSGENSNDT